MSLLIFSPNCSHSMETLNYINKHETLRQIVNLHNINSMGIPPKFRNKITRVPTMLTQNGKLLVGAEIKAWLESLLPVQELESCEFGFSGMTSLDGEGTDNIFSLDSYGQSLQPAMTAELQEKISKDVKNEAYTDIKN